MFEPSHLHRLSGVTFGRVDFTGSMGYSRAAIDSDEILETCQKALRDIKNQGLKTALGGAILTQSIAFIKALNQEKLIDKFETRKVVFQPQGEQFPVELEDEILGWVSGSPAAKPVARLLSALATQAVERRSLATEALEKYREINLLYSIADKLTSCREVDKVVKLALAEAHRLIRGSSAALFLLDAKTQTLKLISVSGQAEVVEPVAKPGQGITGYVAASKKPEIVNDVLADPRFEATESGVRALLCAPMQAQEMVIGVISIYNQELGHYRAEELKLLTAIALQAAPALESALFLQQEMEAARKRETELQEKLQELRIEIDQAKRERQVAEITESDFFQSLKKKAELMRKRVDSSQEPPAPV